MKKLLTALVLLLPTLCFAESNTPALSQFLGQLTCSTKAAYEKADTVALGDAAFAQAAESCVPKDFKPELAGLPESVRPATREERITSIVRSLKVRMSLCQQQNMSPNQCIKMFAAAED